MAFNKAVFRRRTLTAVIFAAIMLIGLLWNRWSFFLLFSIIHFGCWWEYLRLQEKIQKTTFHFNLKLGLMILGYGLMYYTPILVGQMTSAVNPTMSVDHWGTKLNLSFILIVAGTLLTLIGTFQQKLVQLKSFVAATLGLLYISLSCGLMLHLYLFVFSEVYPVDTIYLTKKGVIPVILIASIWINDTMAYIVGSFIGKTPLSAISPKKTWEGTIGGIALSILVVGFLFPFINDSFATAPFIFLLCMIALIAAVTGTLGDLIESKLKRMAGVKDSGSIMPGHGGFLDRFDSLLIAIPVVWLYLYLV